jgi:cytochrome d ubiquinol oxidase subunit II
MTAADVLLAIMWMGLTLYALLGGADFGGGFWDLIPVAPDGAPPAAT